MSIFNYTLTGTIEVPGGSTLTPTGTGIILPDGRCIKLWEVVEMAASDVADDHTNLSFDQCLDLGIFYDGDMCRFEHA